MVPCDSGSPPGDLPSFPSALDSGSDSSSCPLRGTRLPPVTCAVVPYLQRGLHLVQLLSAFSITRAWVGLLLLGLSPWEPQGHPGSGTHFSLQGPRAAHQALQPLGQLGSPAGGMPALENPLVTDFSSLVSPSTSLLPTGAVPASWCLGLLAPICSPGWSDPATQHPLPSFILAPGAIPALGPRHRRKGGLGAGRQALPVPGMWGPS